MRYRQVSDPLQEVLAGVSVSIVAEAEESLVPVEQALWRAGARVHRTGPRLADWWSLAEHDVLVLRIVGPTEHGIPPRQLETIRSLAPSTHVIALVDGPLVPVPHGLADFAVSPFHPEEVVARIARLPTGDARERSLTVGNLALDVRSRVVRIDGRPVETTFREFEVLRLLLVADGRVLTRREIAEQLGCADTGRAVDIHVHRLRAKFESLRGARIKTVRGVGYRLSRE